MMDELLVTGANIFDGFDWHEECDLRIVGGKVAAIGRQLRHEGTSRSIDVAGKTVIPGFIDLQVNGGGGVMLNDERNLEGIKTICSAHAAFGTTSLLPTLITDTPDITRQAIEAGLEAKSQRVDGFLGLHLEGPHLSVARKGAHEPSYIRPMREEDLSALEGLEGAFDALLLTVAPENVTIEQVSRLAAKGLIVSLGHTNCSYDTARHYIAAGARTATHLFNAMSPLENRNPGLVGAVLDTGDVHAGIIADGFHVHPASMRVALHSKTGPGHIFVVTDAMSTIGTNDDGFMLNGRQIYRKDGRLTLADGTLAGADIDMFSSVRFLVDTIGLNFEEAVRMATVYPASAVRLEQSKGSLLPGRDADFLILESPSRLSSTWIGGREVSVSH